MNTHIIMQKDLRLGTLLVKSHVLEQSQLNFALDIQKQSKHLSLGEVLLELRLVSQYQLYLTLSKQKLLFFSFLVFGLLLSSIQPAMAKSQSKNRQDTRASAEHMLSTTDAQLKLEQAHMNSFNWHQDNMRFNNGIKLSKSMDYNQLTGQLGSFLWDMLTGDEDKGVQKPYAGEDMNLRSTTRQFQDQIRVKLEFSHSTGGAYQLGLGQNTVSIGFHAAF